VSTDFHTYYAMIVLRHGGYPC